MVMAGVVVHLSRRHRVCVDEASGESLPGCGVGVNIGGVFGRRGPMERTRSVISKAKEGRNEGRSSVSQGEVHVASSFLFRSGCFFLFASVPLCEV
jgi:hypothetical protein